MPDRPILESATMPKYIEVSGLSVAQELHEFIESEALVGLPVSAGQFWDGLSELAHELGPKNRALLSQRADIQKKLTIGISRAVVRHMTPRPIRSF